MAHRFFAELIFSPLWVLLRLESILEQLLSV